MNVMSGKKCETYEITVKTPCKLKLHVFGGIVPGYEKVQEIISPSILMSNNCGTLIKYIYFYLRSKFSLLLYLIN